MSTRVELGDLFSRLAFSRRECAAAIGVSERHLIEEIRRGKLRETRSGKRRLISRKELDRYLAAEENNEQLHNDLKAAS
ncbi:MAG TPA: helix-turn-helix domain-containing protein [Pyrinomonadaceae bacterium]|nr:helix-turn-helix domain-containing protein [Pyrinomonadaceae bacterium]